MYHVPTSRGRALPSYRWLFVRTLGYCFAALWLFSIAATYDEVLGLVILAVIQFKWFVPWFVVLATVSKPLVWLIAKLQQPRWVTYSLLLLIGFGLTVLLTIMMHLRLNKVYCIYYSCYFVSALTSLFALGGWASTARINSAWLERGVLIGGSIIIAVLFRTNEALVCPAWLHISW